jgi:hypothetical protein
MRDKGRKKYERNKKRITERMGGEKNSRRRIDGRMCR